MVSVANKRIKKNYFVIVRVKLIRVVNRNLSINQNTFPDIIVCPVYLLLSVMEGQRSSKHWLFNPVELEKGLCILHFFLPNGPKSTAVCVCIYMIFKSIHFNINIFSIRSRM